MANMKYCRFQNTLMDLRDCAEGLDEKKLSPDEERARLRLVDACRDIVEDWDSMDHDDKVRRR